MTTRFPSRAPLFAVALAVAATGCATTPGDNAMDDTASRAGGSVCDAQAAQRFVGSTASSEIGGEIMTATGARTLRWGPPDSAFTMDFRPDRVTVLYDRNSTITEIRCG